MLRITLRQVSVFVGVLWLPHSVAAAPILRADVAVFAGAFAAVPAVSDSDLAGVGGTAEASATLSSSSAGTNFVGTASSHAAFGELGAGVSAVIENYPAQTFTQPCPTPAHPTLTCSRDPVVASAEFIDTLTIDAGAGQGFLTLTFDVDGSATLSYSHILSGPNSQGFLTVGPEAGSVDWLTEGFRGSGRFTSEAIPFTYGVPFTLAVELTAAVIPYDLDVDGPTYSLRGTADYLHTATLSDFRVFADASLAKEVVGFSVVSESGTDYAAHAVPEPASVLLFGTASLGSIAAAWRRRRTGSSGPRA